MIELMQFSKWKMLDHTKTIITEFDGEILVESLSNLEDGGANQNRKN